MIIIIITIIIIVIGNKNNNMKSISKNIKEHLKIKDIRRIQIVTVRKI
jgi:hypothetical protein